MEMPLRRFHESTDTQRDTRLTGGITEDGKHDNHHARLTAYGAYWSIQRTWTSKGSITALSLRGQKIFKMDSVGEYEIQGAIMLNEIKGHNNLNTT